MPDHIVAALGIVVNDQGKFLMTLRNDPDNANAHLKWELPGGGIERGETPEEAVVREVREEVGVKVELLRYPSIVISIPRQNAHNVVRTKLTLIAYLSRIVSGEIRLDNRECIDYRWVGLSDLQGMEYLFKTDELLEKAQEILLNKK